MEGNQQEKHQEIDQGPSTCDDSPKTPRIIPEIDQGDVVATPETLRSVPIGIPFVTPPHMLGDLYQSGQWSSSSTKTTFSTPTFSIPSPVRLEYSTPTYHTPTPLSTPTLSFPSHSPPAFFISSTTATPLSISMSDDDLVIQTRIAKDLSMSNDDDESKLMEELEAKLEFLIHASKKIPELRIPEDVSTLSRRSRRRVRRKLAKKHAIETQRPLAKVWKELTILKQKSEQKQVDVDKRWSIRQEIANLFDVALKFSYPQFKEEKAAIVSCVREEYGDYQCENVISIWPKLREEGTMHGPRSVGWEIKKNLQLLRPEMIERKQPWVIEAGIVTIKLSGKWMAKSVHKMLRDGIDTWAPKFVMERVIVNFPSCDMADLLPMDLLRREIIKTTSINMLKFCKIDAGFSTRDKDLPEEEKDKFLIEKRGRNVSIFRNNVEEEQVPLLTHDGWPGIEPMNDIADLWYGLEEKKADWMVCVTPVQQQGYFKMCIKTAQHAGWLPLHTCDSPRASYTGYQIFNTKLKHEDLDSLLNAAKSSCEEVADELGYTREQVSNCALKYTILKNNRLADYTFDYEEMLNAKGNTFVYLLNTQFRIRSFTKESREAIDKLKKDSKLTLGKGEIWKEGVERELVLRLLEFTKVIVGACLPVFPHILCEYLYDLSKNFNSVCEVGFVRKTTKLLLYEATRVVMEKGFQLLGITPESSSLGDIDSSSSGLAKPLFEVERCHKDDPLEINTRIELFSVYPYITTDPDVTDAVMFGNISIFDGYNVRSDGWGLTITPDYGFVALFDCDGPNSVDITNGRPMYLGNPSSHNLVPFSSDMSTCVDLYARTEWNDDVFELSRRECFDTDFKEFLEDEEAKTRRSLWISSGRDGCVRLYYILLKDAVESTIKVMYDCSTKDGGSGRVFAEIFAYYGGDFFEEGDPFEKKFYTACLFRNILDPRILEVPLQRSLLAVPADGSIVIEATLFDADSWDTIMSGRCTILAQSADKDVSCGSFRVSVDWSRG